MSFLAFYYRIYFFLFFFFLFLFFFNDTATTEIYTLSLHDALPIFNMIMGIGEGSIKLFFFQGFFFQ